LAAMASMCDSKAGMLVACRCGDVEVVAVVRSV
jgi:hypothetical protein